MKSFAKRVDQIFKAFRKYVQKNRTRFAAASEYCWALSSTICNEARNESKNDWLKDPIKRNSDYQWNLYPNNETVEENDLDFPHIHVHHVINSLQIQFIARSRGSLVEDYYLHREDAFLSINPDDLPNDNALTD